LNRTQSVIVYPAVNRLVRIVALLLAAVWLPVVSHCDLERLPGLEFLACCDHPDAAPHEDECCRQGACAVVESGHYRVEEQPPAVPAPLLLFSFEPAPALAIPAAPPAGAGIRPPAPPELSRIWQFSLRAARPPRAPSIAS
jgi:hypothetical protein